jgi:hypothetical protein
LQRLSIRQELESLGLLGDLSERQPEYDRRRPYFDSEPPSDALNGAYESFSEQHQLFNGLVVDEIGYDQWNGKSRGGWITDPSTGAPNRTTRSARLRIKLTDDAGRGGWARLSPTIYELNNEPLATRRDAFGVELKAIERKKRDSLNSRRESKLTLAEQDAKLDAIETQIVEFKAELEEIRTLMGMDLVAAAEDILSES